MLIWMYKPWSMWVSYLFPRCYLWGCSIFIRCACGICLWKCVGIHLPRVMWIFTRIVYLSQAVMTMPSSAYANHAVSSVTVMLYYSSVLDIKPNCWQVTSWKLKSFFMATAFILCLLTKGTSKQKQLHGKLENRLTLPNQPALLFMVEVTLPLAVF